MAEPGHRTRYCWFAAGFVQPARPDGRTNSAGGWPKLDSQFDDWAVGGAENCVVPEEIGRGLRL